MDCKRTQFTWYGCRRSDGLTDLLQQDIEFVVWSVILCTFDQYTVEALEKPKKFMMKMTTIKFYRRVQLTL